MAERYELRRLLGRGSRTHVYLAHDVRLDRDVALSLIGFYSPRSIIKGW